MRLPHLVAVHRLPLTVTAGGIAVRRTGRSSGVAVVGDLHAHVAETVWRTAGRSGTGSYEVLRTHDDACAVTVVLHGQPCSVAHAVGLALRDALLDEVPWRSAAPFVHGVDAVAADPIEGTERSEPA